ncbi:MAG: hypothetical protein M3070_10700 [Actinomycetota bacterium]|nr:hypothetical protein [Actinomycetota bacterium]
MSDQLVERLAASRVVVCPTLGKTAGGTPPPGVLEIMKRTGMTWEARLAQVARMHHAGVRLISGADAGIHNGKPHGILPEAVADLVLGGGDTAHALASATSAAADALGLGQRKGRFARRVRRGRTCGARKSARRHHRAQGRRRRRAPRRTAETRPTLRICPDGLDKLDVRQRAQPRQTLE